MKLSDSMPKKVFTTNKNAQSVKEIRDETGLSDKKVRIILGEGIKRGTIKEYWREVEGSVPVRVYLNAKEKP